MSYYLRLRMRGRRTRPYILEEPLSVYVKNYERANDLRKVLEFRARYNCTEVPERELGGERIYFICKPRPPLLYGRVIYIKRLPFVR